MGGSIPDSMGQLTNLIKLRLNYNQLTGSIPDSMGQLTNLIKLELNNNQLTGSIPDWMGQLTNLKELELNNNQLTGSIPDWMGQLTNLKELWLNNNQLTGSIPDSMGQLTNLKELRLNSNQLTGSIPDSMGQLTNLQVLYLNNNQLTGDIPLQMLALRCGSVNISDNYLVHHDNTPKHWEQVKAFQNLSELKKPAVEIPQAVLSLLQLGNLHEQHTRLLQSLQGIPTKREEWNAQGIPIGFPDNSVWQSVSRDLQDLSGRAKEARQEYAHTTQRIQELQQELVELQAKEAEWAPWQDTLEHLEQNSTTWLKTSQALAQMELKISSQSVEEFTHHIMSTPSCGALDEPTEAFSSMQEGAWPIILRSAGFSDSARQLMHDMQQTLYGEIDTSSLSMEERLDLRYLKSMVMHDSIPFVHPFHHRHEVNQRLRDQDEKAPAIRFQATHECVVCDCGTPAQLVNLLKEWKSPLARLDWQAHAINGPRLINIKSADLLEMFHLAPRENAVMMKAIKACKKKHNS